MSAEPNKSESQVVSRAIAKLTDRLNEQIRTVEDEFIAINDGIEHRMLNASEALDECLIVIDNSLSKIPENYITVRARE